MTQSLTIGFLLFPNVTQVDMTGPAQGLSRVAGASVHYVWERLKPVMTDAKFSINPMTRFDSGLPEKAPRKTLAMAREIFKSWGGAMDAAIAQAAAKLNLP